MKIQNSLLALIGACLMSCSTTPTNSESWMANQKNACLPTAIAFREGLQKYDVWSEVLRYEWIDKKTQKRNGHAIVVYMYPKGQNKLWTYDFWGSYRIRAFKDNPLQIAQQAVRARSEDREVYFAEFLK